jgi:hypothetical protein
MVKRSWPALAVGALAIIISSCGLLDTETPDLIDPEDLNTPEGAQAKRVGAISELAFAQASSFGQFLTTGYFSDEFLYSSVFIDAVQIDERNINENNNPTLSNLYFQLQRARGAIETAATALQTALPAPEADTGIPEMLSLEGFTYLYFAEDFCSGVPIGHLAGDSLIGGNALTTAQLYDTALARFDSALAHPAVSDDPSIEGLARVGRARTLLDQGESAAAATAVEGVPTDFQYVTEHANSPDILVNGIFAASMSEVSVADQEGENGLPYRTADDPRVPFVDTGQLGLDGMTPQFNLLKYPDFSSPTIVADGVEARLIEAEAQLQANDTDAMLTTLNALRAAAGIADLDPPATTTQAEDLLFGERAFWLFATGHRLGDMRRLIRQYGRAESAVFPVGPYPKGGSYGTDVNLPIPVEERNNPNFHGCLDREA